MRDSSSSLYSKADIPGSININFTSSRSVGMQSQPFSPPPLLPLFLIFCSDTMASSPSGYDFGRYHSFEEERSGGTSVLEADGATPEAMQEPFPSTCEPPSVWCIDCQSNQIVIGCSNGRLELWEATSGKFKVRRVILCETLWWISKFKIIIILVH
jgi:hypothetical protein